MFPSISCLNKELRNLQIPAGIIQDSFKLIAMRAKNMPATEKYAALVMDEIAIKELIEYDPSSKTLSGTLTIPSGSDATVDDGTFSSDVAGCMANVFMLRMVNSEDKFIVGYDMTDGTFQGEACAERIKTIVRMAKEAGVTVVSHSQDMGSSNIAT